MKKYLFILLATLLSGVAFSQTNEVKAIIEKSMHEQELSWNKGDIDGFMAYYWNSDSLKFIGKKGITFGWKNTLDNYKKNYPTADIMGKLTFSIISVEQFSDSVCYVTGKWDLKRIADNVGGYYTLLWKKIDGKWVIVADHTS